LRLVKVWRSCDLVDQDIGDRELLAGWVLDCHAAGNGRLVRNDGMKTERGMALIVLLVCRAGGIPPAYSGRHEFLLGRFLKVVRFGEGLAIPGIFSVPNTGEREADRAMGSSVLESKDVSHVTGNCSDTAFGE
jgi:hypothetical protein